jgi:hypothetical protein
MSENAAPAKRSFDLTINLGHILTLVVIIAGIVGTSYIGVYRLDQLDKHFEKTDTKLEKIIEAIAPLNTNDAIALQRIADLERRMGRVEGR